MPHLVILGSLIYEHAECAKTLNKIRVAILVRIQGKGVATDWLKEDRGPIPV
jgi:hypothetical protein